MKYEIEKDAPPFVNYQYGMHLIKYPFRLMNVNDSFLVTDRPIATVKSAVYAHNARHKETKFRVRVTPEGVRVWRIA
jgi:hypothetical protein